MNRHGFSYKEKTRRRKMKNEREVRKWSVWFDFRPTTRPRKNVFVFVFLSYARFANTGRRIYLNIRLKSRVESLRELLLLFLVLVCRRSGPELVFVKESIHRGAKPVRLSFSNSWKIQMILSNLSIDRHASLHLLYLLSYILFYLLYAGT